MSALFIGSSSISRTVSLETTDRASETHRLLEQLTAIGVSATRPRDPSDEGESPSLHFEIQRAPAVIIDIFFRGASVA